ncbi:hypothetical protein O7623_01790 [Solwaraspora sp. WMMD791]|uniref:hypothetical protein n=1 Tax=Solwaraspora sp. WMMD791 TaxID=3016086 RepID=UPI00249BBC43|nr:hypothetical protein [Solwaraspora sp. WMMD791]WFE27963.1 hypothetical protein O7623_01790 [Solwaraspora sp. WMMD791]
MADGEARTVTTAEFLDELVAVTRQRDASTHLYLNLEVGGRIWVQWEQPGVDHPRRYQVVDDAGPACPHCTIIDAVARLAPVLPLDALRLARSKPQYEAVLATGRLPSLAFGRRSWDPTASWAGDCHAAAGDPHTPADCVVHCRPSDTADVGDPLTMADPLPLAVQQQYPDPETAVRDVAARLAVARDWRDAAEEVAGGRAETEGTRAFLARCPLALPVSDAIVLALRPGEPASSSTLLDLLGAAGGKLGGASLAGQRYHRFACLVPEPTTGRFPTSGGSFDVAYGEPIRTLRLPTGSAPLSRRGRGILLLFEARHTMNVHAVPVGPGKPPGYWQSEAALHVFEFGLLSALGGGYETAVNVFLAKLRRTGDLLDRPERVLNRRQRKALAEPFGNIDDFELHLWASVAYRNATYLALGSQEAFAEHLRSQDQLRTRGQ